MPACGRAARAARRRRRTVDPERRDEKRVARAFCERRARGPPPEPVDSRRAGCPRPSRRVPEGGVARLPREGEGVLVRSADGDLAPTSALDPQAARASETASRNDGAATPTAEDGRRALTLAHLV